MFDFLKDRKLVVWLIFTAVFVTLMFRLAQLTIVEGDELYKKSLDTRLKKVNLIAKRGEIYDRNGVLLATNVMNYSVEFLSEKKFSSEQEKMMITLFNLLHDNGENYITLPIKYKDGEFYYESDIKRINWLVNNEYSENTTAREVYDDLRLKEGIPDETDDVTAFKIFEIKDVDPPINPRTMTFSYDAELKRFLKGYNIDFETEKLSAREAFDKIKKYYNISKDYSDQDAYFLAIIRDAIRNKGYMIYEPIKIAKYVSKKTAIEIQEKSIYYKNVSVIVEPSRYYPITNSVSHILGYMGFIATDSEIQKYSPEKGYNRGDLIGKTGIEGKYEEVLRGQNGHEWIEANSFGSFVRKIENSIPDDRFKDKKSSAGESITLTIDTAFQEKCREYLIKVLESLRVGKSYESKYGNLPIKKAYSKADTGAVVVQNVKNGEILALVSIPDYDISLFANGISYENWLKLEPSNKRNPLAPKPLYNLATMSSVQPGSTFKMVTAFAGLEAGLNPYQKLMDAGYIETSDGRRFGCGIWNMFRGTHGPIDLAGALAVSCNYYFFDVSKGYDFANDKPLNFTMNTDKIIEAAAKFGLGSPTGIEISERVSGLPDTNSKKATTLHYLEIKLNEILKDYLPDYDSKDEAKKNEVIDRILYIGNTNSKISRPDLIEVMRDITRIQDQRKLENLSDIIKFSYFNQMNWTDGDNFNLAIGQGSNAFTPVQMARYVSTIANNGLRNDSTLIKKIGDKEPERKPAYNIDPNGNIKYIKEGMYAVAYSQQGSLYSYFKDFPMKIGAKTGTAEKEGKLPPENEEEYLLLNLKKIAPHISKNAIELETAIVIKERIERVSNLYSAVQIDKKNNVESESAEILNSMNLQNYLSRGYAMREAIKRLSNDQITDEMIDNYKEDFDDFTWFVCFAPYDDPQIAISVMIPQGGSGSYGALVARDIIGEYFKLGQ